jgi:hypothetical protein
MTISILAAALLAGCGPKQGDGHAHPEGETHAGEAAGITFSEMSSSKPFFIGGGYDRKSGYLEYRR